MCDSVSGVNGHTFTSMPLCDELVMASHPATTGDGHKLLLIMHQNASKENVWITFMVYSIGQYGQFLSLPVFTDLTLLFLCYTTSNLFLFLISIK